MSYGSNLTSTEAAKNSVANAIGDFDPVLDRATKYAEHLRALCDRLHGPHPAEVQKDHGDAPMNGLIPGIHQRRSRLVAILDDIERSIQNLDGAL